MGTDNVQDLIAQLQSDPEVVKQFFAYRQEAEEKARIKAEKEAEEARVKRVLAIAADLDALAELVKAGVLKDFTSVYRLGGFAISIVRMSTEDRTLVYGGLTLPQKVENINDQEFASLMGVASTLVGFRDDLLALSVKADSPFKIMIGRGAVDSEPSVSIPRGARVSDANGNPSPLVVTSDVNKAWCKGGNEVWLLRADTSEWIQPAKQALNVVCDMVGLPYYTVDTKKDATGKTLLGTAKALTEWKENGYKSGNGSYSQIITLPKGQKPTTTTP